MNQSQALPPLDAGLILRPFAADDAKASLDLVNAFTLHVDSESLTGATHLYERAG